ncbi:hypothetical protein ACPOL_6268 [Acidisarcina polymorpha]|uniref:Uncharacterized protein n=1 Tax=Acidisarcina polymorpha TaxID=2211140 RepID=A0A2Z5G934_9BACT|nr:hypothetical protein ACPOL_6268 [Acidisarcina polymorpha]
MLALGLATTGPDIPNEGTDIDRRIGLCRSEEASIGSF